MPSQERFLDDVDDYIRDEFLLCQEEMAITLSTARNIAAAVNQEFEEAMKERGQGIMFERAPGRNSIAAIDCWSTACPTGREIGNYYAIDLGGSNLRAVCVRLEGRGESLINERKTNLRTPLPGKPKGLLDKDCTAKELFDAIAETVEELMKEVGDDVSAQHNVAFTFSFPVRQKGITTGELLGWTKEFETGCNTNDPVVGQDVGELLDQAFKRRGLRNTSVGCLINDTVGTMLSAGYAVNHGHQAARCGVILGTGFNIAYMDKLATEYGYAGQIVNLECGNFDKLSQYRTLVDQELDYYSTCRSQQMAEKMISGLYLGEVCRLWILRVFRRRCPAAMYKRESLQTDVAATIYNDKSKRYTITASTLKDVYDWDLSSEAELRVVYKIVCLVFDRSASLAGIMTYVCCMRTKFVQRALGGCTVGIDGSLYILNSRYQKNFQKTVQKLLGNIADLVQFAIANDGSGKGAAIMAACI